MSSSAQITVSAVRPCRSELQRERCLPFTVAGPVLLEALRRLASICLKVVIGKLLEQSGSFCNSMHRRRSADRRRHCFCSWNSFRRAHPRASFALPGRKADAFQPERAGGCVRVCASLLPPRGFVAMSMNFAMMAAAQRDREFIAHFAP